MGARSRAREAALQMLYAAELGAHDVAALVTDFWREFPGDAEGRAYADAALQGVRAELTHLDEHVVRASKNWRIARMSPIARSVLRLGTWELLRHPEIPRAVIIDEAVELAKRFIGPEAGGFVNGVLDQIADACGRRGEPSSAPSSGSATSHAEPGDMEPAIAESSHAPPSDAEWDDEEPDDGETSDTEPGSDDSA